MNIRELLGSKGSENIQVVIGLNDLKEYSNDLINSVVSELGKPKDENETYLDADEVTDMLKVNRSTLWRWNKAGYLKTYKIGEKVRYKLSEVKGLLNGND